MPVHIGKAAVAAGLGIVAVVQPVMVLVHLEIGQAVLPFPGIVPGQGRTAVVPISAVNDPVEDLPMAAGPLSIPGMHPKLADVIKLRILC